MNSEIFRCVADVLCCVMTVAGFGGAYYIYLRDKRDRDKKYLAEQVRAFYFVENAAVKKLAHLTGRERNTIKIELRNEAQKADGNTSHKRPELTPAKIQKFL